MPQEPPGLLKAEYPHEMYPADSPEMQAYKTYADLMLQYEEVRTYFMEHPDPECIPLFLNSFGSGFGLGIYQMVEWLIEKFSQNRFFPIFALL